MKNLEINTTDSNFARSLEVYYIQVWLKCTWHSTCTPQSEHTFEGCKGDIGTGAEKLFFCEEKDKTFELCLKINSDIRGGRFQASSGGWYGNKKYIVIWHYEDRPSVGRLWYNTFFYAMFFLNFYSNMPICVYINEIN